MPHIFTHAVKSIKKLRILQVSFDANLQPYQLAAFCGALAAKFAWKHDYPLIQYKIDTYKEQMRPMLLCLKNGIEEAHHLFNVNQYTLNTWKRPFAS